MRRCDEHLRTLQPDLFEQLLEQFAGAADERHPLLVLARPRRLADEHQLRIGVAGAEYDGLARRRQLGTADARARLREHLLERLAPLGGRQLVLRRGHRRMVNAGDPTALVGREAAGGFPGDRRFALLSDDLTMAAILDP